MAPDAAYDRFMKVLELGSRGRLSVTAEGTYACSGVKCCHSASSSDWKNIDWASRVNEVEFDELDFSCCALLELGMCIYKPLSLVLCVRCKFLLDLKSLRSHAQGAHQGVLPWTRPGGVNKYDKLISHVKDAFDIPEKFLPPLPLMVHRPIPLLDKPEPYLQCPNPECGMVWICKDIKIGRRGIHKHFQAVQVCNESDEAERLKTEAGWTLKERQLKLTIPADKWKPFLDTMQAYGQLVYPGDTRGGGMKRLVALCPTGWAPQVVSDNKNNDALDTDHDGEMQPTIVDQSYAEDLGWKALFNTSEGDKINDWKLLLTPFDEDEDGYEEEERKKTQALERGISEVRAFLYEYLESANLCVKSYSEVFRQELTPSSG